MPKAIWKGKVIAEAKPADVEIVEGNIYFPSHCVKQEYLRASDHHSVCHWKGTADYYHVMADGDVNENAAWYYPSPKPAANRIAGYIAFWRGVEVTPD